MTRALIGEYPSLMHESPVNAVAMAGSMIVTGCEDHSVQIWQNDQVPNILVFLMPDGKTTIPFIWLCVCVKL